MILPPRHVITDTSLLSPREATNSAIEDNAILNWRIIRGAIANSINPIAYVWRDVNAVVKSAHWSPMNLYQINEITRNAREATDKATFDSIDSTTLIAGNDDAVSSMQEDIWEATVNIVYTELDKVYFLWN